MSSPEKAQEVAKWLGGLPLIQNARPVKVTVGNEVFYGAQYQWDHNHPESVSRGYDRFSDRFYLLGECPVVYQRAGRDRQYESKIVFTYQNEEWYAGGGYSPFLCKPAKADFVNSFTGGSVAEYHPFGYHWDLSRWPMSTHGKIDQYSDRPRKRFPIGVDYL